MSEQTVNVPLLRKAIEWAEDEAAKPALECRWDQGNWVASPLDRARDIASQRVSDDLPYLERRDAREALAAELAPSCGTCYCIAGYVAVEVLGADYAYDSETETIAANAMGLADWEAERLFDPDNTIADVRRIAEDIAGERL